MADDFKIQVEGLREFRRELKKVDSALPKELRKANKQAAELIIKEARANYPAIYTPRTGRALGAIKPASTQTAVRVAMDGARAPYIYGQEFGSRRLKRFQRGPSRGGSGAPGNFFYPAIRKMRPRLIELYGKLLDDLAAKAFPGRTGGGLGGAG